MYVFIFLKIGRKTRRVAREAGIPKTIRFQTRHQLALEMLKECGGDLPHSWIAGDDEMGRPSAFRLDLRTLGERYLLAVPSNTLIRDIEAPAPVYSGRGRHPKNPFIRVDKWCSMLPEDAWTKIDVRDGEKGPLVIEAVKCRVQARTDTGGTGPDEVLFITRKRQPDNTYKIDYYLSNATADVTAVGIGPGGHGGASHRRMLPPSQRRSRFGGLSGENLDRLASSPNPLVAGRVVPEQGDAGGKKKDPGSDDCRNYDN